MRENNLAKNTTYLVIGTLISKGLLFVMSPLFSRWISVEAYGSFDLLVTYASLLLPLLSFATGEGVFRFCMDESDSSKLSSYISTGLIIPILNSLILGGILIILAANGLISNVLPFYVLVLSELLNAYFLAYLRATKKLPIFALCNTLSVVVISISVTVLVKVFDLGLDGMIYGYSIGYTVSFLFGMIYAKYWDFFVLKNVKLKTAKELIKYSFVLIPNSLSWWVISVSDRTIINIFIGPAANGIYAVANKIPAIAESILQMFNLSWQESAINVLYDDDRDSYYNETLKNLIKLVASTCILILSVNFMIKPI